MLALGDSITAHFHIPEEWINAKKINKKSFEYLPFIIGNEFDWPQLSALTGKTPRSCCFNILINLFR